VYTCILYRQLHERLGANPAVLSLQPHLRVAILYLTEAAVSLRVYVETPVTEYAVFVLPAVARRSRLLPSFFLLPQFVSLIRPPTPLPASLAAGPRRQHRQSPFRLCLPAGPGASSAALTALRSRSFFSFVCCCSLRRTVITACSDLVPDAVNTITSSEL
jgi:hypothetical protein